MDGLKEPYLWFSIVCFMFVPNYCCFLKQAVMFQFLFFPLTLQVSMVFSSFKLNIKITPLESL